MLEMAKKDILPAMSGYTAKLSGNIAAKKAVVPEIKCTYEHDMVEKLSGLLDEAYGITAKLEADLEKTKEFSDMAALADYFKTEIIADMTALRSTVDTMEVASDAKEWPYPTYGEILFGVR